jgi:hypothetical protein
MVQKNIGGRCVKKWQEKITAYIQKRNKYNKQVREKKFLSKQNMLNKCVIKPNPSKSVVNLGSVFPYLLKLFGTYAFALVNL